jgi:hypothetical protein
VLGAAVRCGHQHLLLTGCVSPVGEAMGERAERVWERIAAAHEGDLPVSVAALCRAAVRWLGIDGAIVAVGSGQVAREPLFASDELSGRLEELLFMTGEGPGWTSSVSGRPCSSRTWRR